MSMDKLSEWMVDSYKHMDKLKKIHLICIGYAGSVAANFNFLEPYLGDSIELSVVEYKGRGTRRNEPAYQNNKEMTEDVAEQINKLNASGLPYAILGYSMGVQVVYEVLTSGLLAKEPIRVFLAAHEPPDIDCFGKSVTLDNEEEFLTQIQKYGGLDERLLADKRFREIFLSRIKVDYWLLKEYQFSGKYIKVKRPTVIFYCEEDTPYEKMQGWKRFVEGEPKFHQIGEDHFFFKSHPKEFCDIICRELAR